MDVINAQDEVLISLQKILVEEPWKVIRVKLPLITQNENNTLS